MFCEKFSFLWRFELFHQFWFKFFFIESQKLLQNRSFMILSTARNSNFTLESNSKPIYFVFFPKHLISSFIKIFTVNLTLRANFQGLSSSFLKEKARRASESLWKFLF